MTLVIGFRSYLSEESKPELEMQVREAKKHFPSAKIIVAACGMKPDKLDVDKVIHYSSKAIGLTKPWEILIEEARKLGAGLILVDGDDQHIFSEIKRVYDANKDKAVVIPEREKRTVFLSDSNLSRAALEDLENGFLRMKHKLKLTDPQPGLFMILDKDLIKGLSFKGVNQWVGDLAFLDQLLSKKVKIAAPKIKVRPQTVTTLNIDFSFKMMLEIEKYFGVKFKDIMAASKKEPEHYLHESRLQDIDNIRKAFNNYQSRQHVSKMKGLILSGGFGERLRPITHTTQKQIIPIANKPILFYVIEDLAEVGIKDIGIVVGPNKEQIKKVVGDGSKWNVRIKYIEQDAPRGLAHCILISKQFLGDDDFVMYLGDNMLRSGISDFAVKFKESGADASILLTPVPDPERFGLATLNGKGEVVKLEEKPKKPESNLAIIGIYAFKNTIHKACSRIKPSKRGELEITDAMQWLLDRGMKITSDLVQGWWKDTGKADALLEVNQLVLDNRTVFTIQGSVDKETRITGRVAIGKNSSIKKGTVIRGPVIIGDNCTIGPDTFIGPYTSIGDNCKVVGSEVEHTIMLNECRIEAGKRIVDSVVGQNCTVTCAESTLPRGHKLIIGDNSEVEL